MADGRVRFPKSSLHGCPTWSKVELAHHRLTRHTAAQREHTPEDIMALHRRTVLKGLAASTAAVSMPWVARAQAGPMRVGFLTVKTGPLASGGLQMEQGLAPY